MDRLALLGWDSGWAEAARQAGAAPADQDLSPAAKAPGGAAGGPPCGDRSADGAPPRGAQSADAEGAIGAVPTTDEGRRHGDRSTGADLLGGADPARALLPGRVIRADRGRALVQTGAGVVHSVATEPDLTTGDWVLVDGRAVRAVLPRRTAVVRGAGRRDARAQVLAANVDVVLLVVALATAPNLARLDRLLTVAWGSGARPLVVLSKADLSPTAESERDEVADAARAVPVVLTSVLDGRGLDELRGRLARGRTVALLGTSGVGKSSLVNALAGREVMQVRPVRLDGKGRHTTAARELVVLPGLGVLIDTPGLRGVQVWDTEPGFDRTFADIEALAADCRFPDCQHRTEPGCAVTAAVADGRLSARRLDSHARLQRERAWLAARYDARLRAEERRRWRTLARSVRARRRR